MINHFLVVEKQLYCLKTSSICILPMEEDNSNTAMGLCFDLCPFVSVGHGTVERECSPVRGTSS